MYNQEKIVELDAIEINSVNGAILPLLVAFAQGFAAGAGAVAAGGAILDAAGVVDLW